MHDALESGAMPPIASSKAGQLPAIMVKKAQPDRAALG
ncbi:hypothetical protein U91I_04091 [alpha proteobacterium U9-1i]|nr:hypothetical protein U91I_04091 [alpha proteobacterium U9-1i]